MIMLLGLKLGKAFNLLKKPLLAIKVTKLAKKQAE